MYRTIINVLIIILLCFTVSCNSSDYYPLNVTFKNATLSGSNQYVIIAVYLEDKRIREKYTDILVFSEKENFKFLIAKENGNFIEIEIQEKDTWYSITNLLRAKIDVEYTTFAKAQTTTYIIKSTEKAKLKFQAVGGDYPSNENYEELENVFAVSKIFQLKIENTNTY